jgi:hypothetical protein
MGPDFLPHNPASRQCLLSLRSTSIRRVFGFGKSKILSRPSWNRGGSSEIFKPVIGLKQ